MTFRITINVILPEAIDVLQSIKPKERGLLLEKAVDDFLDSKKGRDFMTALGKSKARDRQKTAQGRLPGKAAQQQEQQPERQSEDTGKVNLDSFL